MYPPLKSDSCSAVSLMRSHNSSKRGPQLWAWDSVTMTTHRERRATARSASRNRAPSLAWRPRTEHAQYEHGGRQAWDSLQVWWITQSSSGSCAQRTLSAGDLPPHGHRGPMNPSTHTRSSRGERAATPPSPPSLFPPAAAAARVTRSNSAAQNLAATATSSPSPSGSIAPTSTTSTGLDARTRALMARLRSNW